MPLYECKYVKPVHKTGTLSAISAAMRNALLGGHVEDVTSWEVSRHGPDEYQWSGNLTVSQKDYESSRLGALRMFLHRSELPEDVIPSAIQITEMGPDASAVKVPVLPRFGGDPTVAYASARVIPDLADATYTGLSGAGE